MAPILIVEDEERIASFVAKGLRAEGHQPTVAADGPSGLDEALSGRFDLMVLDIGLPGMDGFAVLDQLRSQGSRMPVIILTARDSVTDTVTALDSGADDYMAKPFRFAELMARIRLRLRSLAPVDAPPSGDDLVVGRLRLDRRTRRIVGPLGESELSAREFKLLKYFVEHRGAALSRDELLNEVWGYNAMPSTRTVDVHVAWLRQKVEDNPRHPQFILTVHGLGYKFVG